jgi:hypothetical protein
MDMKELSKDDFAHLLMAIRQGLRLLLVEMEKWLRDNGYLKAE